jgi:hypothetical protein
VALVACHIPVGSDQLKRHGVAVVGCEERGNVLGSEGVAVRAAAYRARFMESIDK